MQENFALRICKKVKQRTLGYAVAAVAMAAFAIPQQADAAAFVWVAGNNFAYSAAACATPGASFYAWALFVGGGATSYAWTACSGPFGGSASFAIARAGVGGGGAAFAGGIADPWAGIQSGTDISNFSDSSTFSGDSSNNSSEFTGSPYSFDGTAGDFTGIHFDPGATDGELNGVDSIAAYQFTGTEDSSTLCALFGASSGCDGSSQSSQAGDVTDFSSLSNAGLTLLGSTTDPSLGTDLTFNQSVSDSTQIILIGQGDAASDSPEPVSFALIGAGLCGLAMMRRRRKA